jgi:stage II sporulation protein AB (anti-sigma F factor)
VLVYIDVSIEDGFIEMSIKDSGLGIIDVEEARQPLFTTKPDLERSGMGFTIMENFMDEVEVHSQPGRGTEIRLKKHLQNNKMLCN